MFLKIMSDEDMPDEDSRKGFQLFDHVEMVRFQRIGEEQPRVSVVFAGGPLENFYPRGNCYILNDSGKQVASFGVAPFLAVAEK